MGTLVISHFGGLSIQNEGQAVELPADFPRALFTFLSQSPGMLYSRSLLCDTLWPNLARERALRALSTALWRLRKCPSLRTTIAQPDRNRICFAPARRFWVDTHAFQHHVMRAQKQPKLADHILRRALALYQGAAFLDLSEEWAISARVRMENLYCDALFLSAGLALSHGRLRDAQTLATRLITFEPFREDVREIQIRAALLAGNRAQAEHYYREFAKMLANELDVLPGFTLQDFQPCPDPPKPAVTVPHLTRSDRKLQHSIQSVQLSLRRLDRELSTLKP